MLTAWGGLLAPIATPTAIVQDMNDAVRTLLSRADMGERFTKIGAQAMSSSAEEMKERIDMEYALWGEIIKQADIKPT